MDATDNRLLATQYYGCWVLDLYNRGRPHTSLGPGTPDAPRDRSHHSPMAIRSLITIEWSRSRFSADCTTSIVSSRWPHEPTGGRREFLRTTPVSIRFWTGTSGDDELCAFARRAIGLA